MTIIKCFKLNDVNRMIYVHGSIYAIASNMWSMENGKQAIDRDHYIFVYCDL